MESELPESYARVVAAACESDPATVQALHSRGMLELVYCGRGEWYE